MKKIRITTASSQWTPPLPLSEGEQVIDPNGQTFNELTLEDMRMDKDLHKAGCDLDRSIVALKQVEKNINSENHKRFTTAYENYKKSKQ